LTLTILFSSQIALAAPNLNNVEQTEPTVVIEQVQTDPAPVEPTKVEPVVEPVVVAQTAPKVPQPTVTASSSCASEIKKYDWNQTVAYEVMMAESSNNHSIVNDNPSTGDYSVGCFQINLYGNLRNTRPSESWLKVPENNVAHAYKMYQSSGWSPWGYTTCRYKVSCY